VAIITADELRSYLGIQDDNDDPVLTAAATATSQAVMEHCGRSFEKIALASETARVFPATYSWLTLTDDFWDASNLVVKTDDGGTGTYGTTWTLTTDYVLEPYGGLRFGLATPYYRVRAVGGRTFPSNGRAAVQVTAAWGWSAVPAAVKQAALLKGAKLFRRKDSPEGVLGIYADLGAPVRISAREDPDVAALLGPFRRPDITMLVA
jgi:hypothetical protein